MVQVLIIFNDILLIVGIICCVTYTVNSPIKAFIFMGNPCISHTRPEVVPWYLD